MYQKTDVPDQLIAITTSGASTTSLSDIWNILCRRWRLFVFTASLLAALGTIHAFMTPHQFTIKTLIEIGVSENGDGSIAPIESPATVVEKLNNTFIPLALHRARSDNADAAISRVRASSPPNSGLVVLESIGEMDSAGDRALAQKSIVELLQANHSRLLDVERKNQETQLARALLKLSELEDELQIGAAGKSLEHAILLEENKLLVLRSDDLFQVKLKAIENQLNQARLDLAAHVDHEKVLTGQLARLAKQRSLLDTHIKDIDQYIAEALHNREQAVEKLQGETNAMMLLLLDGDIQTQRARVAQLNERREISLEESEAELTKNLQDNQRLQNQQRANIGYLETKLNELLKKRSLESQELESRLSAMRAERETHGRTLQRDIARQKQVTAQLTHSLARFRDTRALSEPLVSVDPVGVGKLVKIAVSLLLGLIVGAIVVLFAEFAKSARVSSNEELHPDDSSSRESVTLPLKSNRRQVGS